MLYSDPLVVEFCNIVGSYADNKVWFPTGSRVTCLPPVTDTDIDVVCIYNGAFSAALQSAGFEITPHSEYPNDNLAACYRKGHLNIIACRDIPTYESWRKATALASVMNLQEKHQRIILFQFVTEGKVRGTDLTY